MDLPDDVFDITTVHKRDNIIHPKDIKKNLWDKAKALNQSRGVLSMELIEIPEMRIGCKAYWHKLVNT